MLTGLDRLNLLMLTVSTAGIGWLAVRFWIARNANGLATRRMSELIVLLAGLMGWLWLVRADVLLDIVPGLDVLALYRDWLWVPHALIAAALLRLWAAMQGPPR